MNTPSLEKLQAMAAQVPLFEGLSQQDYETICNLMMYRQFNKGDAIVHEEDQESQTFFIIVSGKVYVTVITPEGRQTILANLKRGDFFGEMSLLDGQPRSASVIAAETCELFMLHRKSFLEMLTLYPKITIKILVSMSHRLRRTNKQINTLSMVNIYGRITEMILQYGREQGVRYGDITIISNPPTQQMIAEMVGTSRETVSRVISQLKKKRYITLNRKRLVILNEEKLYS